MVRTKISTHTLKIKELSEDRSCGNELYHGLCSIFKDDAPTYIFTSSKVAMSLMEIRTYRRLKWMGFNLHSVPYEPYPFGRININRQKVDIKVDPGMNQESLKIISDKYYIEIEVEKQR